MSTTYRVIALVAAASFAVLAPGKAAAEPMGTAFRYQGQLKLGGAPVDGSADFVVRLYADAEGGVETDILFFDNLVVTNGLFEFDLDVGGTAFQIARWLEIDVRAPHDPSDSAPYTTLAPRQRITPAPYSLNTRGLTVDVDGLVGIGTEQPDYDLHIFGETDRALSATTFGKYGVYGQSLGVGGVGVYGTTAPTSGESYGVFGQASNDASYAGYFQGGRNYFQGKVGIGTTTPSYNLTVQGSTNRAISATNSGKYAVYGQASNVGGVGVYGSANPTEGLVYGVYGETYSGEGFAGYFKGGRNYFEGNVGIGTEDPAHPLTVQTERPDAIGILVTAAGDNAVGVYASSEDSAGVGIRGESTSTSGFTTGVHGITHSSTGKGVYGEAANLAGSIGIYGRSPHADGYAGYFAGGKNYFQNPVGIGTSSPAEKLHIAGANANIRLSENNGSPFIQIGDDDIDKGYLQWWSASDSLLLYTTNHTYPIGIGPTSVGGLAIEPIAEGGNVGVGTTTPNAKFQIDTPAGTDPLRVRANGTNTELLVHSNGYTAVGAYIEPTAQLHVEAPADVDGLRVRVGNTTLLAVKRNGTVTIGDNNLGNYQLEVRGTGTAGKPGGGSWSNSSDRRLKKNIRDLSGSLEKLLQLRPVTFEYRDPEAINELDGERIGMIAQEVEAVFPDWVSVGGHGYKTLTFRGFEALAVDALRELRAEKDRQLAERDAAIQRLRDQNEMLERRLAAIEARLGTPEEHSQVADQR